MGQSKPYYQGAVGIEQYKKLPHLRSDSTSTSLSQADSRSDGSMSRATSRMDRIVKKPDLEGGIQSPLRPPLRPASQPHPTTLPVQMRIRSFSMAKHPTSVTRRTSGSMVSAPVSELSRPEMQSARRRVVSSTSLSSDYSSLSTTGRITPVSNPSPLKMKVKSKVLPPPLKLPPTPSSPLSFPRTPSDKQSVKSLSSKLKGGS